MSQIHGQQPPDSFSAQWFQSIPESSLDYCLSQTSWRKSRKILVNCGNTNDIYDQSGSLETIISQRCARSPPWETINTFRDSESINNLKHAFRMSTWMSARQHVALFPHHVLCFICRDTMDSSDRLITPLPSLSNFLKALITSSEGMIRWAARVPRVPLLYPDELHGWVDGTDCTNTWNHYHTAQGPGSP